MRTFVEAAGNRDGIGDPISNSWWGIPLLGVGMDKF